MKNKEHNVHDLEADDDMIDDVLGGLPSLQSSGNGVGTLRKMPMLMKQNSAPCNLQRYSGLNHLTETVMKVPNKVLLRQTSLCSLARVFDQVAKTNADGDPFYVKDLVMIDARLRDWARVFQSLKPSFDVRCSLDSQIISKLIQSNVVFICNNEEEYDFINSINDEAQCRIKTTINDKECNVIIHDIEDLITIKNNCPQARIILQRNPLSPREQLTVLINESCKLQLSVVGLSIKVGPLFVSGQFENIMENIKQDINLIEKSGFKIKIVDFEDEVESDITFDKSAKLLNKLIEKYFPPCSGIVTSIAASTRIADLSHFLFTRVTDIRRKPHHTVEILVDWPEDAKTSHCSVPSPCKLSHPGAKYQECKVLSQKTGEVLHSGNLPELVLGEWIYWNSATSQTSVTTNSEPKHYHSFRFEGPEKKFEITFGTDPNNPQGLRKLTTEEWQEVLNLGHLLILSEKKNELFDSYLLSESSLFVYPNKAIIKTCGISSPLLCTPALKEISKNLNIPIESVSFSRRSFICPQGQCYPHRSIDEEEKYLRKHFPGGETKQLGDVNSDHWYLYSAKLRDDAKIDDVPSFEMTMTGVMNENALKLFWKSDEKEEGTVSERSGFAQLTPGADIDEYSFTPCGFSYNGLKDNGFVTVHITPELPLCYISFETNISGLNYENIVNQLVARFEPAHFTVLIMNNGGQTPSEEDVPSYKVTHKNNSSLCGVPVYFERRRQRKALN